MLFYLGHLQPGVDPASKFQWRDFSKILQLILITGSLL